MTLASSLAAAAAVGFLSGTHAAIWGMYKDAIHEGFSLSRLSRSILVGPSVAVGVQLVIRLPLPSPAALVVLFGLAYAAERGVVEVWKTFVREEDQSKYFIPMQFSLRGAPVLDRRLRLAAGGAYVATVALCLAAIAKLDRVDAGPSSPATIAVVAFSLGTIVALGGAWKDAPKEGFQLLKFFRSPAMTVCFALALSRLTSSCFAATVAAIGFERAAAETWKTFFFPSRPRGKFAGKPILHPDMLHRRRRWVPVYVAISGVVLLCAALAAGAAR